MVSVNNIEMKPDVEEVILYAWLLKQFDRTKPSRKKQTKKTCFTHIPLDRKGALWFMDFEMCGLRIHYV